MQLINHKNVIRLYDVKQSLTKYYLITEYCSGGDLEVFRGKKFSEAEVQKKIHQISAGLKALIEKNVMHRDLKLNNILLSNKKPDAIIKLADFGFARELSLEEYAATCCGTPLYMAPEVLLRKKYNLKADLWSVGVITYLFLTGKFPFHASTPQKLQIAISLGTVKFPPDFEISDCCFELLKNLLQINPEMRMDWEDYFAHPFIKSEPKRYEDFLKLCPKYNISQPLNASILILNIEMTEEEKTELIPKTVDNAKFLIQVLKDASLKTKLILDIFNTKEGLMLDSQITSYQKEIFDLLWKLLKIVKPIVGTLITSHNGFLFDSYISYKCKRIAIITKEKPIFIELTKSILDAITQDKEYEKIAKELMESYETIASNYAGYIDLISTMHNYKSKIALFKFALSLAQEACVLENSAESNKEVRQKYMQVLLIINLLLREYYDLENESLKAIDDAFMEYEIIDDNGKRVNEKNELESEVKEVIQFAPFTQRELEYITKIKAELYKKCFNT